MTKDNNNGKNIIRSILGGISLIDLTRNIEVLSGDYRRVWLPCKVVTFGVNLVHCFNCDSWELEEEKEDEYSYHYGKKHVNIWVGVEFEDGGKQMLSDVFGRDKKEWRYA